MTLDLTMLLRPLVIMPIVGLLLFGAAILVDRLRRRRLHARGT
jgi:hypothetical protein